MPTSAVLLYWLTWAFVTAWLLALGLVALVYAVSRARNRWSWMLAKARIQLELGQLHTQGKRFAEFVQRVCHWRHDA